MFPQAGRRFRAQVVVSGIYSYNTDYLVKRRLLFGDEASRLRPSARSPWRQRFRYGMKSIWNKRPHLQSSRGHRGRLSTQDPIRLQPSASAQCEASLRGSPISSVWPSCAETQRLARPCRPSSSSARCWASADRHARGGTRAGRQGADRFEAQARRACRDTRPTGTTWIRTCCAGVSR